tara:strand:+ start:154 stop:543 length:390 start_codon:yes stop_codon:yes gene_type:complete
VLQLAVEYIDLMYEIADQLPKREEFNLGSQTRRAATSVALKIAEGSTGQSDPEQSRFLGCALRSLMETVACQHLIKRREYEINPEDLVEVYRKSETLSRKLQAMKRAITPRGNHFREDEPTYTVKQGKQ